MTDKVLEEKVTILENDTGSVGLGNLRITVRSCSYREGEVVIGRAGSDNILRTMQIGDAVLFETPDDGLLEVRMARADSTRVTFLITQVSPKRGIAGGLVDVDPSNLPFTDDELVRIESSVAIMKAKIAEQPGLPPEKFDLIARKLDEMAAAAERMGRKDWINLAVGTLTGMVVTLGLDSVSAKALFVAADAALSWLLRGPFVLLP